MPNKLIKASMIAATLVLSHGIAYRIGAALAREHAPQSKPAIEPVSALPWLAPRAASVSLHAGDRCASVNARLEETQAENQDLTERLDENNRMWRSVLLGPDAADRSGNDSDDDDAKDANTEPQSGGWLNGTPPTPPHPLCMARCDLIQKWARCGSPPS